MKVKDKKFQKSKDGLGTEIYFFKVQESIMLLLITLLLMINLGKMILLMGVGSVMCNNFWNSLQLIVYFVVWFCLKKECKYYCFLERKYYFGILFLQVLYLSLVLKNLFKDVVNLEYLFLF